MKHWRIYSLGWLILALTACWPARAAETDNRVFEMRVYYAAPEKLDALLSRFRDHTCKLFEKHGMVNVGYWVPVDNKENRLIYILAYPSREAAAQSWKNFMADPDWQSAQKASEVGGKLVQKVESVFMKATDYSPMVKAADAGPRLFELRTYKAAEGRLSHLHARFRDHTCKLFEKYGMANIGYWSPLDADKGANDTLIYVLGHKSRESAKAAFTSFGADPEWKQAREQSEKAAGGSLTVKDGVQSVFMKATDFSPIK